MREGGKGEEGGREGGKGEGLREGVEERKEKEFVWFLML